MDVGVAAGGGRVLHLALVVELGGAVAEDELVGELADVGHVEGDPAPSPDHDRGRPVAEAVVHHHPNRGAGRPDRSRLALRRPGLAGRRR
ncbi:MAG TPA: hypothetical protein VFS70_21955, partial [Actinomycetota bacterium]|nr:hypothetical protein [Actinomycetota bacterium]